MHCSASFGYSILRVCSTKRSLLLTRTPRYLTLSQNLYDTLSFRKTGLSGLSRLVGKGIFICLLGIQKQVQIFAMCCNVGSLVKIIRQIDFVAMQPTIHISSAYFQFSSFSVQFHFQFHNLSKFNPICINRKQKRA